MENPPQNIRGFTDIFLHYTVTPVSHMKVSFESRRRGESQLLPETFSCEPSTIESLSLPKVTFTE